LLFQGDAALLLSRFLKWWLMECSSLEAENTACRLSV